LKARYGIATPPFVSPCVFSVRVAFPVITSEEKVGEKKEKKRKDKKNTRQREENEKGIVSQFLSSS
jgi:hypothetical protein